VRRIPRVDCGYASFLPQCPDCPWRGLPRATRDDAAAVADRHAVQVHGDRAARLAALQRDHRRLVAR
jgi:hypothetical protein